jgi:hypothetical protein
MSVKPVEAHTFEEIARVGAPFGDVLRVETEVLTEALTEELLGSSLNGPRSFSRRERA